MRALASALLLVPSLAFASAATDLPCHPVEAGVISIDGILDDWEGEPAFEVGGKSADFSLGIKCNYDASSLYLLVDVKDDVLFRTKGARPLEDNLQFAFAGRAGVERLIVYPGDARADVPRKIAWAPARPVEGVDVMDSLMPKGWAVELRIPLAKVPGWGPGASAIRIAVAGYDVDAPRARTFKNAVTTAPFDVAHLNTIEFAHARAALDAFLRDRHLTQKDVRFDQAGTVFPGVTGRAIVAGKTVAVIGEEYSYLELPVASAADVGEIKLIDLAGDGQDVIVVRYKETVSTGERELLGAFRIAGDGLRRVFAVEVGKAQGAKRLATKVSFVKRGRATDVLVEPLAAVGWTEGTFKESPAEDAAPILLPWGSDKRARYQFHGDEYSRAE